MINSWVLTSDDIRLQNYSSRTKRNHNRPIVLSWWMLCDQPIYRPRPWNGSSAEWPFLLASLSTWTTDGVLMLDPYQLLAHPGKSLWDLRSMQLQLTAFASDRHWALRPGHLPDPANWHQLNSYQSCHQYALHWLPWQCRKTWDVPGK